MRTKNSMINITVSCISYAIIMIGSFVTRNLFASILGLEFVGIEGTFTNAISMLSIVELGLGVGIVYKLYKPLVEENWEQISAILCYLKRCYIVISMAMLSIGIVSSYFIINLIKEDFSRFWLLKIFMLYVADVMVSYIFSHKRSLFIADQKNYVNNLIHIGAQIMMFVLQIIVLKVFHSFECYLIVKIICRAIENITISIHFNLKYKFVNLKTKKLMPDIEKRDLFKSMKALLCHKISSVSTLTVSNLIVAWFVSLRKNGIYHNYTLIVGALLAVTSEVFHGITASFGNLLNTTNKEKVYKNFNTIYFLNFIIYSFVISSFFCLATPFMNIWIGENSVFNMTITAAISVYLYIYGIRQSITMAKTSAGIYDPDKYITIFGALLTMVLSLILVHPFGIIGVMLGNVIGILSVSYWVQPYLVYSEVFHKSVKSYHAKFAMYSFLTFTYAGVSFGICNAILNSTDIVLNIAKYISKIGFNGSDSYFIAQIVVNFLVCIIVPNVINIIIFYKTDEFQKLKSVAKSLLRNLIKNKVEEK